MSLLTIILISLAIVSPINMVAVSSCSCWDGFEPFKSSEGVKCFGKLVLNTMPCNVPKRPDCKCSINVDAILVNSDGIWCTKYDSKTKKSTKWPCENQNEWKQFEIEEKKAKLHL